MNEKRIIAMLSLLGLSQGDALYARTIQSPLPLYHGYPAATVHYPVDRFSTDECREIEFWGAAYSRSATDAYGPTGNDECPNDSTCTSDTASRVSIAELIFGKDDFTLVESFANSTVTPPTSGQGVNPFIVTARIQPDYAFYEKGVFFGGILGKRFCNGTTLGVRLALPYREINVDNQCSDIGENTNGSKTDDLFIQRGETPPGGGNQVPAWAARLDYLSLLDSVYFTSSGGVTPLVNYADTTAANQITIGGLALPALLPTGGTPANTPPTSQPSVDVIQSTNGLAPTSVRWANYATTGSIVVTATGTGLSNLARGRFASDVNYTPLASLPANQAQLWVVPNLTSDNVISNGAGPILTAIQDSQQAGASLSDFLTQSGLNFCAGRSKGIGDLDMEFYVGKQNCEYLWGELQLGVRFPTGRRLEDPKLLIRQPLGNNGHFEVRPGIVFGTDYFGWFNFKADLTYSIVTSRVELLPAPFSGATVRNIGPAVRGKVSWGYFLGDIDVTICNPCNPWLGATVAYQPYVKRNDKVTLACTYAPDLLGVMQKLDGEILQKDTHRVAHTLRTEIFFANEYCNITGGFAQVVAGENCTRDTDIYIAFKADF